jgi:hypothetical protein
MGQHSKNAQELLGPASISIALDVYGHVLPRMRDVLPEAMDGAL